MVTALEPVCVAVRLERALEAEHAPAGEQSKAKRDDAEQQAECALPQGSPDATLLAPAAVAVARIRRVDGQ